MTTTSMFVGKEARRHAVTMARMTAKVGLLPLGIAGRRRARDVGDPRLPPSRCRTRRDRHANVRLRTTAGHARVSGGSPVARGRASHGGGVVLTFDDGTRDFYDTVLPLLVARKLPGVLYLATAMPDVSNSLGLGPGVVLVDAPGIRRHRTGDRRIPYAHALGSLRTLRTETRSRRCADRRSSSKIAWGRRAVTSPTRGGWARLPPTRWPGACSTPLRSTVGEPTAGGRSILIGSGGHRSSGATAPLFFRVKVRGMLDSERHVYRLARRGPWRKR